MISPHATYNPDGALLEAFGCGRIQGLGVAGMGISKHGRRRRKHEEPCDEIGE
jgi:hypothetical protein